LPDTRERWSRRFGLPVSGLDRERPLARHKYGIEKRQRELKKEQKKEEKRQRKLERRGTPEGADPEEAPAPDGSIESEPNP
jgi:hypothetical protein